MKLADTPGRVYRMGTPAPTTRERVERYATAPKPFVWCFPRVLGTDGQPVSPVWRAHAAT